MLTITDAQTTMCISISQRPGNLGTLVHNAGYKELGLNFIYKAFAVSDIIGAIAGIKALGIRGCSVSMPFKETVVALLDELDDTAKEIGAVNTIVNEHGILSGFNTDMAGAKAALQPYLGNTPESILVLGSGGVARAIIVALRRLRQKNIILSARNVQQQENLAKLYGVQVLDWDSRHQAKCSVIINATPIGMQPHIEQVPINLADFNHVRLVMDVVASPAETTLIKQSRERGLIVVTGLSMALEQAYEQFYLYTGKHAPREVMHQAAINLK